MYQLPVIGTWCIKYQLQISKQISTAKKYTTKTHHKIVDWNNLCSDVAVAMFDKRKKK